MAINLIGFRVFIASPHGLQGEREAFRRVLLDLNEDDAHERGATFLPVGWELTLGGTGRPQERINADIKRCDYLVLVLWDRWGTPPADDGPFTSGTEEEYMVALDCLRSQTLPMRDLVVMFKGVDPRQLSDPGPELEKVLEFKQRLESEKSILYSTFDTVAEFERHIQRHALGWLRTVVTEPAGEGSCDSPDEEDDSTNRPQQFARASSTEDQSAAVPSEAEDMVIPGETEQATKLVARAEELEEAGRLTEAEALYARAVVVGNDTQAIGKRARFLRRTGRLDQAATESKRLLSVASEAHDRHAEIEALSTLAIVRRKQGRLADARASLADAMEMANELGEEGLAEMAFLYDNIGLTKRKGGSVQEAIAAHEKALEIQRQLNDCKGVATALNNLSPALRQAGRLDDARKAQCEALEIFDELGYRRGIASGRANMGEILELEGDLEGARREYESSLTLHEKIGNPEGVAMNLWELGRITVKHGSVVEARRLADRALASEDTAQRPEGTATALHLDGLVKDAEGRALDAAEALERATERYAASDHVVGLSWSLADLAKNQFGRGRRRAATQTISRAIRNAEGVEHKQLWDELQATERLIAEKPER
jgi:tetratricopeptide (TPR) repeat protein